MSGQPEPTQEGTGASLLRSRLIPPHPNAHSGCVYRTTGSRRPTTSPRWCSSAKRRERALCCANGASMMRLTTYCCTTSCRLCVGLEASRLSCWPWPRVGLPAGFVGGADAKRHLDLKTQACALYITPHLGGGRVGCDTELLGRAPMPAALLSIYPGPMQVPALSWL